MAFNPFRDLIDVLTGRTGEPTIPTATEPARVRPYFNLADPHGTIDDAVRRTGNATASGPGAFANTGSIRTPRPPRPPRPPRAPRIDTDALRRAAEDLARAAQNTRTTTTRTTIGGGRGVSVNTDSNGSNITVNGRTITVTPQGDVTVDGEPIDGPASRTPYSWAIPGGDEYRESITRPGSPTVTLTRETANQIENLLINIEGTNKITGTRINTLRRILSDAITKTDRATRR